MGDRSSNVASSPRTSRESWTKSVPVVRLFNRKSAEDGEQKVKRSVLPGFRGSAQTDRGSVESEASEGGKLQRTKTQERKVGADALQDHQERIFTRWWQSVLPPGTHHIVDLCEEIQKSAILVELIETLSGERIPGVSRKAAAHSGAANFAALGNIKACLDFCTDKLDVKLINVTAKDIADGKRKQVLGLTCACRLHPHATPRAVPPLALLSRSSRAPVCTCNPRTLAAFASRAWLDPSACVCARVLQGC